MESSFFSFSIPIISFSTIAAGFQHSVPISIIQHECDGLSPLDGFHGSRTWKPSRAEKSPLSRSC